MNSLDPIEDYMVNGVPARLLFERCWNSKCCKKIPKGRRGMYKYYCSDECEKADSEMWGKLLKDAGLI